MLRVMHGVHTESRCTDLLNQSRLMLKILSEEIQAEAGLMDTSCNVMIYVLPVETQREAGLYVLEIRSISRETTITAK